MNNVEQSKRWDERYNSVDYAYGKQPNAYLKSISDKIPSGNVLCLAEGEGRNAVYLAENGHLVTAVDFSGVGLEKALNLAKERGVEIRTIRADLNDYQIRKNHWQAIVSVFVHLPIILRKKLHKKVTAGLAPGGVYILEAYEKEQLHFNTGGPLVSELLMDLDEVTTELSGLNFEIARRLVRPVFEGTYHNGEGSVIQILARKPQV